MGRHAGSPKWAPSDRGLAIIQTWVGSGTFVLTAVMMVIALIGFGTSSVSGPSITLDPPAVSMQRLVIALDTLGETVLSSEHALGTLVGTMLSSEYQFGQFGRQ